MIQVIKKQKGFGDTVAFLTEKTGIAYAFAMASNALGVDCGCKERQEKLNKLIPYGSKREDSTILLK